MQLLRLMGRRVGRGAKLALPLLLLLFAVRTPAGAQAGGNQAGLVVVHGDGRIVTRCVRFDETQISGLTLLQRSGIALEAASGPMGSTICSLNGEGCSASDCWCECKGTPCAYWIYFQQNSDGSWAYANIGAAMRQLVHGDVDGWMWGDTTSVPPAVSFDAICGTADLQGASTPVPTEAIAAPTTAFAAATTAPAVATTAPTGATADTRTPDPAPSATATMPAPEATHTPRPSATPAAPTPTAGPEAASSETPVSTAIPPTAAAVDGVADAGAPASEPRTSPGYVAFAAILGVVGGVSLLIRHRRREG